MSLTDITPLETELAFRQSQQKKDVPAHKKVSKPRLKRYKPYMRLEKYSCTDCGRSCDRQYDHGLCYECAAKEFGSDEDNYRP